MKENESYFCSFFSFAKRKMGKQKMKERNILFFEFRWVYFLTPNAPSFFAFRSFLVGVVLYPRLTGDLYPMGSSLNTMSGLEKDFSKDILEYF